MTANKCKLAALLLALLLTMLPHVSLAGVNGAWDVYTADQVDLNGITENSGRLTGTVQTFRPKAGPNVLTVDCPVPEEFTLEQAVSLTVAYEPVDKKALSAALAAVGTQAEQAALSSWKSGWYARGASYQKEGLLDVFYYGYPGNVLSSKAAPAGEKSVPMAKARETAAAFLQALGFTPYRPGMLAERLYDPQVYGYHPNRSDFQQLQQEMNRDYQWTHRKYQRTDFNYTVVSLAVTLRGLPAAPNFSWPDGTPREPDATVGATSRAILVVKDDGAVVQVSLEALPQEVSASPLTAAPASWQDALKEYIATYHVGMTTREDTVFTDAQRQREYTAYATYQALTQILPVYMSHGKLAYVPGWCFVIEERLVRDDAVVSVSSYVMDAQTLRCPDLLAFK